MAEVEPAVAHVRCPACDEVIDVTIPVNVTLNADEDGTQYMAVAVDAEAWDPQPVWDHVLMAHGPLE